MSKYQFSKLKDVAEIIPGFAFKSDEFGKGEQLAIKIKDIQPPVINFSTAEYVDISAYSADRLKKFLLFPGDFAVAMTGATIGKVGKNTSKTQAFLNQRVAKISPTAAHKEFVFYTLFLDGFIWHVLNNLDSSSAQGNISAEGIGNYFLPLPPHEQQRKIAASLSALDAKIDCNNRINAELEAMAKTLYDYWFVQFDFPDVNGKPYKSSGGKMIYNATLKREIPARWEVNPLETYLQYNTNKLGAKHSLEFINYLDTANLTQNRVGEIQRLVVGMDEIPSRAKLFVSKNDILYSTVRPNQYHFGLIRKPAENMVASTGFVVLSCRHSSTLNAIFYLYLTADSQTKKLIKISESSKSSYPSIAPDDILNLNIAFPTDGALLERIAALLNPCFDQIDVVQRENQQLAQLRDWLLPLLMNGQVTVA